MAKFQNRNSQIFVDYIPAEIHENKTWEIVYYVKNPFTEKLERKRHRVKPLVSITERRKLAKRMRSEINKRLESNWNPFLDNKNSKEFYLLKDVFAIYLKQITVEYKDGNLSFDTHRAYTSRVKNILLYLKSQNQEDMLCHKFDADVISGFLDDLRYAKKLAAITRDNYLTFIITITGWMRSKKYLTTDPCAGMKKINNKTKTRIIIPAKDRIKIFDYFKEYNPNFLVFSMTCYYCLMRRTELTKIKVSDVDLENSTLQIRSEDSKNKKTALVTIPPKLYALLKEHIKNASPGYYLFSRNNYAPGSIRCLPDAVGRHWRKMRADLNLPKEIQWYSLKDTGITDLIMAGVPLLSVRDQARHHSITQTDEYTPRSMRQSDDYIINSGVKFNR